LASSLGNVAKKNPKFLIVDQLSITDTAAYYFTVEVFVDKLVYRNGSVVIASFERTAQAVNLCPVYFYLAQPFDTLRAQSDFTVATKQSRFNKDNL
jgi:hypothetical protein